MIQKLQTLECKEKQKRNHGSHWRVKQGVSLNYTSLNWPQAGEALTLSRIQMWRSQGWGPAALADPQVESRQAGPAVKTLRRRRLCLATLRPLPKAHAWTLQKISVDGIKHQVSLLNSSTRFDLDRSLFYKLRVKTVGAGWNSQIRAI